MFITTLDADTRHYGTQAMTCDAALQLPNDANGDDDDDARVRGRGRVCDGRCVSFTDGSAGGSNSDRCMIALDHDAYMAAYHGRHSTASDAHAHAHAHGLMTTLGTLLAHIASHIPFPWPARAHR